MPRSDSLDVANALHRAAIRLLRMVRVADAAPAMISPWAALQVPLLDEALSKAGAA